MEKFDNSIHNNATAHATFVVFWAFKLITAQHIKRNWNVVFFIFKF